MRCISRRASAPAPPPPSYRPLVRCVPNNPPPIVAGGHRKGRNEPRKGTEGNNAMRYNTSISTPRLPLPVPPTDLSYDVSRTTHPLLSRGGSLGRNIRHTESPGGKKERKQRRKGRKGRQGGGHQVSVPPSYRPSGSPRRMTGPPP